MSVETFSIEVTFRFNHALFRVESISRGILEENMPEHSHGHGNYEIHYISSGKGSAVIDNSFYSVLPTATDMGIMKFIIFLPAKGAPLLTIRFIPFCLILSMSPAHMSYIRRPLTKRIP